MVLHVRVQARAQAELYDVFGSSFERLPFFADRSKKPYINAMVKEVLGWNPAVPLGQLTPHYVVLKMEFRGEPLAGLPHRLTRDDSSRGYLLPKGLVVWANIWLVHLSADTTK